MRIADHVKALTRLAAAALFAAAASLGALTPALAQTPPAGTAIQNVATASYTNTAGQPETLNSNTVSFNVAQVASFTLAATQTRTVAPGGTVNFPHVLTNTGNGSDTFTLAATNLAGGGFDFTSVQIFRDGGGGNPTGVPIAGTGALAAGAQFAFVVVAQVPGTATAGQTDQIRVDATSAFDPTRTTVGGAPPIPPNVDTAQATGLAVVTVSKSLSVVSGPSPNAGIVVTLQYTNTSATTAATNLRLTDVIGGAGAGFNTTGFAYVPGSGQWSAGGALTDAAGGDPAGIAYDYNVTAPLAVTATIANVPAGATGTVRFTVNVNAGLANGTAQTDNRAGVSYNDGAVVQSGATNNAAYTVTGAAAGPDLVLAKSHVGNLTAGATVDYALVVRNAGGVASAGAIVVADTLPAGLSYVATGSGGNGWTCVAAGQVVTCTSSAVVPAQVAGTPGVHPDPLTIRAQVDAAAFPALPANVNNVANVSGGGEQPANAGNNGAVDPGTIQAGAQVSGLVWVDRNHNRVFDDGPSSPAAGWTVELCPPAATTCDAANRIASGVTGANGTYTIGNLVPGTYKVHFRSPGGTVIFGRPINGDGVNPPQAGSAIDATGEYLVVTLAAGENKLSQSLPLDPSGVVYNSVTRQPVAGAVVTLTGPPGFDPAVHLIGGAANVAQTVGADGFYQYLLTAAGVAAFPNQPFTLTVTPPAGYGAYPSTLIPPSPSLPAGACGGAANCIDPTGLAVATFSVQPADINTAPPPGADTRYFVRFAVQPGDPDIVNNHLPLDPAGAGTNTLFVQKTASTQTVSIGEFVDYTVQVKNATAVAIANVNLTDVLPFGFVYVRGTARVNGAFAGDPLGGGGPTIVFPLGTLATNATATVTYRVRVGPGAQLGDGTNRASAAGTGAGSNVAQVRVQVIGGVFDDRGYILGKIFADCNANGVQDAGELGIPGVRLYLEDGTFVISDSEGKYSFYGVTPRTHVLKVDPISLPLGAKLALIANRQAFDPGSRFVDLKNGELHRGDFAVAGCEPDVLAEVERRRGLGEVVVAETDRLMKGQLSTEPAKKPQSAADVKSLPATGVVGEPQTPGAAPANPNYTPVLANPALNSQNSDLPPPPSPTPPGMQPLEKILLNLPDNALGFINLRDGDTLPTAQTSVLVKGPLGGAFKLSVNGAEVPESRVGKRSVLESKQLAGWEYIGVNLKPGENTLVVQMADPFGNVRGSATVKVIAPDNLGRIRLDVVPSSPADGHTPVKVRVTLTDDRDVPVTSRTPLTLETTLGRWQVQDLSPRDPGVQVFLEGGRGEFVLLPPQEPGDATITVHSGILKAEAKVAFLPDLRPMIAAGVVEGAINFRNLDLRNVVPARDHDGFDQALGACATGSDQSKDSACGRAAFFLKGKVKGDYLLTIAYDSDKNLKDELFRDIKPDEFYPVYGDSSIKGFDAQSSSKLYVRVDKGKSFLLYGDFNTQGPQTVRQLSQYARSFTGAKWHYETRATAVNTFAVNDTFRQIVEEFPANGTSGPFQLNTRGAIVNSEKVEILTRDRAQPGQILKTEPKTRFSDYEIESLTGRILFKAPIPSLDFNLNPISIRVTYELDQGGTPFWTYGADGQYKLTEWLELGANAVRDDNPLGAFQMGGGNATVKLGDKTFLIGEYAATDKEGLGRGDAQRVEIRHEDERFIIRIYNTRVDKDFDNPSSSWGRGRIESGGKAVYKLDAQTLLTGEAIRSEDLVTGGTRTGGYVKVERALNDMVRAEVGVRHVNETAAPASALSPQAINPASPPIEYTSARLRISSIVPYAPKAQVFAEYEQDVSDSERRSAGVGGEYRFLERSRIYGRHQFLSSLSTSDYSLNPSQRNNVTLIGIDTPYMSSGQLFSEYRIRDAIDGRAAEAAVGLRNMWEIRKGLKLSTTSERIHAFSKVQSADGKTIDSSSVAYTGALEYTGSDWWKGSGRLEYRDGQGQTGWLNTLAAAVKIDRDWTGLARSVVSLTQADAGGEKTLVRLQAGVAYRDTVTNRLSALAKVEQRLEKDTTVPAALVDRDVSIFSTTASYQPTRADIVNGRYAAKYAQDQSLGLSTSLFTHLVQARYTRDLNDRWDFGIQMSALGNASFSSRQFGLGAEVGYLVEKNLWISAGYNFFGFKDRDLAPDNSTDRGFFIRFRYKFDEDLFKGIGAAAERFRSQTDINQ
jgi:uncharacterized repeat protein (TIGR01451 family)